MKRQKQNIVLENKDMFEDLSDSPFIEDEEIPSHVIGKHLIQDTEAILELYQKCVNKQFRMQPQQDDKNTQNEFDQQFQQRFEQEERKNKKAKPLPKVVVEKNPQSDKKAIQKQKTGSQNPLNEDIKNFEERLSSFGVDVDESQKIIPNISQEWLKKFSNLKKKK